MATCSRCGGHLTDDHVCRRRAAGRAELLVDVVVASALGGLAGLLVFGELAAQLTGHSYWLAGVLVGPFVAFAVIRSLRRTRT